MSLVERYLAAIDAQLPSEARADVIAELRDTLLNRLEEKEAELGRAPTREEVGAILQSFGHPLVVAGRYRTHRSLIGPDIYPFYIVTLQWVLGIVVFLNIVVAALAVSRAIEPAALAVRVLDQLVPGVFAAFTIVTVVFIVIERAGGGTGLACAWSPRELESRPLQRPGRIWETLFEMAFEAVFILWWIGLIRFSGAPVAGITVTPGPVWEAMHAPILVFAVGSFAVNLIKLARPGWLWAIAAARTTVAVLGVAVVFALLRADVLFALSAEHLDAAALAGIAAWTNTTFKVGLVVTGLITAAEAAGAVRNALRGVRAGAPG